jgi:predicted ATPase/class 3 adenylate cyclase
VTFLFTDIEGSTRLLQQIGDRYRAVLEAHNELVRGAITEAGGVVVRTEGDSFFAVFRSAPDAVAASVAAQRALTAYQFPSDVSLRVRMGLHTGTGAKGGDDYLGIDVHRAARIAAAGHGGQVLLSAATMGLTEQSLPGGVAARDAGDHLLKDLARPEHLYQLVIEGIQDNTALPRSLNSVGHNLPAQLSSFVGRQAEMTEAQSLFDTSRLLTFTGPGGTGKTRLALELAKRNVTGFADGVYFVALAGIGDAEQVAAKVLETFPDHIVEAAASTEDHLIDYVSRRNMLLVLDNFEHVIDAASIAARLLQGSPDSKIIVTSRVPLRVAGEQEMSIPPLAIPEPGGGLSTAALAEFDSVALFAARAAAVRPSFELDSDSVAIVAELVARLDGLPLAIELAASRVGILSPRDILENLSHVMAGGGRRDLPVRQQTMHNTIGWSYDLLPEPAKALFAAMSVFAGGAGLEEIAVIADADLGPELLGALETLVEHSLVGQSEVRGATRFRMLEMVRQFAAEQAQDQGRLGAIQERHAHSYAGLTQAAEPHLTGPDSTVWLDKLSIEHDNIRTAQQWALDHNRIDMAYEMASALWRFFHMRGLLFSARELLDDLLGWEGASPEARAKALEAAGGVAYWSGEMEQAHAFYAEALEILRRSGDPAQIANGLYNLAFARNYDGDSEIARSLFEEAHAIYASLDDKAGLASTTWGLGDAWAASGNLTEARQCFEESIAAFEELDDPFGLGWALYTHGEILVRLGEYESAQRNLERGMRLFDSSDISAVVMYLAAFASLAIAQGDHERGVRLAGAMAGLRDETGTDLVRVGISTASEIDPEALGLLEGDLVEVYEAGREMSADAARAFALETPCPDTG